MIKAVIFDFFGVISIRAQQAFLETKVPHFDKRRLEFIDLRKQHDLGIITVDDYIQALAIAANMTPQEVWEHIHAERVVNKQLLDYITTELKSHYKIGMLSNAAHDLRTFVDPSAIDTLFDEIIISADVGMIKPQPEIFELMCERLGVKPEEAIMIDDLEENCSSARYVGLQTVQYHDFHQMKSELEQIFAEQNNA